MSTVTDIKPEKIEVAPVFAIQYASESSTAPDEKSSAMENAFGTLMQYASQNSLSSQAAPRVIYTGYGATITEFTAALPVVRPDVLPDVSDGITIGELPGGRALRFQHKGAYRDLMHTYEGITYWMVENGYMASEEGWSAFEPVWEEYVSDPKKTPEEELITNIYIPLPV